MASPVCCKLGLPWLGMRRGCWRAAWPRASVSFVLLFMLGVSVGDFCRLPVSSLQGLQGSRPPTCPRRWLRPGGALLPDRVSLHLAAAGAGALDLAFWDDVQGFSYAPVRLAG